MKKIIFIIILILLCCLTVAAYECIKKDHSVSLQKDAAVDIELEGEIILNSWDFSRMDIKVETVITGKCGELKAIGPVEENMTSSFKKTARV